MDTNNTVNSTYTAPNTSTACPIPQACGSRLPCGVCLITNQRCPLGYNAPTITWTSGGGGLSTSQTGLTCTTQSGTTNQNIKATLNIEKE